jgi:hypothetical protein
MKRRPSLTIETKDYIPFKPEEKIIKSVTTPIILPIGNVPNMIPKFK